MAPNAEIRIDEVAVVVAGEFNTLDKPQEKPEASLSKMKLCTNSFIPFMVILAKRELTFLP